MSTLLLLGALLAAVQDPLQDPEGDSVLLDEIVISASRLAVDDSTRQRIQLLGEDHGSRLAAGNLAAVLDQVPGIHVQKTSRGQLSPYLRGLTGFRTLVLVDGIRLNNPIFRSGPNQYAALVDPLALQGSEVVFGPGSVLHGSDAAGGTLLLQTHSVKPSDTPHDESVILQRLASGERSWISRLEKIHIREENALQFGVSYKKFGDFEAGGGEGRQPETGYREWSGDLSLTTEITGDLDLDVGIQHHRQEDVPRTHSTIYGSTWNGLVHGSDLQRDLDGTRDLMYARFRWNHGGGDHSQWTVSRQEISEQEDRIRASGSRKIQGLSDETLGLTYTWTGSTSWGEVSSGFDYYHDRVDSHLTQYASDGSISSIGARGVVADDSNYDLLGMYLQNTVDLSDQTSLVFGGRYTEAAIDARSVDPDPGDLDVIDPIKEDWSDLVGSIRGVHDYSSELQIYGGLSQAFRAPNLSDLTRFDIASSGESEVPTPGLDPEHFLTAEIGFDLVGDEWRLEGVLWHSLLDDLIVRYPTGDVDGEGNEIVTKANAGAGTATGFDLRMHREFSLDWSGTFSCSWITGEVETPVAPGVEENQPLSRLAPTMARIAVQYLPSADLTLEAALTVAGEQDQLSARDLADVQRIPPGGTPGYAVFDVSGRWQATSGLQVYLGIANIGDVDYRLHGSGSNEAGLSVNSGIEATF